MGLMTSDEYRRSLDDGRQVWLGGKRVANVATHPAFQPMVDAVARIYDMHFDPETRDLMTFALPDGTRGSRFYKIPESVEDLRQRRLMTGAVLDRVSPTIDRFGDETVTPLFVIRDRAELLRGYDPRYAETGRYWLDKLQRSNLFMSSGNTDPKGDRSRQPSEQHDPDLYLRVVRETDAGIVIRGAKFETGAAYAHVAFVKPTVGNWSEANRDYAVSCIVKLNAPGVRHICRMPLGGGHDGAPVMERPLTRRFDEIDSLVVFDDVLVPWQDVVFSRQPELARMMRSEFSRWSAQGFLIRSRAKADLLVGAALLASEQAGTIAFPAVRSAISQLMAFTSTIEAFLLASEAAPETSVSGYVMPNQAIQNAGRIYCTQNHHHMVQILVNIAGGQAVMLPDQAMFDSPETGADVRKYFATGRASAEQRLRVLHLVQDLTASGYAGRMRAYQLFAETPLAAQESALFETFDRKAATERAQAVIDQAAQAAAHPVAA
ncbi:MAG TPA: 4-hydroxyphenylacetate 3-hydroxylase N-terminal domain-containing protein [Stellaceae bacterium]|nr:4-hydroxyphenylacetate 3-hydroxylase N-terminal domain-containing protein [Stellaceae bacterium]